jgi:hypothetical protein
MGVTVTNASNIILDAIDRMLNKIELDCKGTPTAKPENSLCIVCFEATLFYRITLVLI